ncbi:MAG: hypothetical protein OXF61_01635 [Acidimicrobiaceae bacterium]|nr:hypothetical protein [Acidimicrobiaceae bacterium]
MPPLNWTELRSFSDDYASYGPPESVGGGWVLRRLYQGPEAPTLAIVSSDGTEWQPMRLPDGFRVADIASDADIGVDLSGKQWVAFGQDISDGESDPREVEGLVERVWHSDDRGLSWTETSVNVAHLIDPSVPYVTQTWQLLEAISWDEQIVAVVQCTAEFDIDALLADRGMCPAGMHLVWMRPSDEHVTLQFTEDRPPASDLEREHEGTWVELTPSYRDLGLSDEQQQCLRERKQKVQMVFVGDGVITEPHAEFEVTAHDITGVADHEGIVLVCEGGATTLLQSRDGRSWSDTVVDDGATRVRSGGYRRSRRTIRGDGSIWTATSVDEGVRIDCLSPRDGRPTSCLIRGMGEISSLSAAAPGVAVAVSPGRDAADSDSDVPAGRVTKGDYELRFNEPSGGLTLWDVANDMPIHVSDAGQAALDEPPDGVRWGVVDGTYGLVFSDIHSGQDLVVFTCADVGHVYEEHRRLHHLGESDNNGPRDIQIGWSPDGVEWDWQLAATAFGFDAEAEAVVRLAVGSDFVLARVHDFGPVAASAPVPSEATASEGIFEWVDLRQRWFIARVP